MTRDGRDENQSDCIFQWAQLVDRNRNCSQKEDHLLMVLCVNAA